MDYKLCNRSHKIIFHTLIHKFNDLIEKNTIKIYRPDDRPCADPVLDIDVIERIPHENYAINSKAQENDIALLRLARPVPAFTQWVSPICLPVSADLRGMNHDNTQFSVAGWGKVSYL